MLNFTRKGVISLALIWTAMMIPTVASADGVGWMIGTGLYYSDLDDWKDADFDNIDWEDVGFDGSSVGGNFEVGYRFNKWLSVDAGYMDLGTFDSDRNANGDKLEFDVDAWTLGGMASVPLWIMDFYAKAGMNWWEFSGDSKYDDMDPYYGLGFAFNIGASLDLYGEWVRYEMESDIDTFGLGVRWTF
jgi:OOP family OmpA-OmpF porin